MTTPRRGLLFHFTHIDNLASVMSSGLICDSAVVSSKTRYVEVGNRNIKDRRRNRRVPLSPYGVVADYVPFYFAARSPMLYSIYRDNVPTYHGGQHEVIYLVSRIDIVVRQGLNFAFTDRNAALNAAQWSCNLAELDTMIDWRLMESPMWYHEQDEVEDRREKRMAEFLIYRRVPWTAMLGIAVKSDVQYRQTREVLAKAGVESLVKIRPDWYF